MESKAKSSSAGTLQQCSYLMFSVLREEKKTFDSQFSFSLGNSSMKHDPK